MRQGRLHDAGQPHAGGERTFGSFLGRPGQFDY